MRRGFTLIELLVVLSITTVLISMLLPAVGRARQAGQRAVSLSNLHNNCTYMNFYTTDHRDEWLNPFTLERLTVSLGWNSCCVVFEPTTHPIPGHQPYQYAWDYGQIYSSSGTETYGYHWLSHMTFADSEAQSRLKTNIAPMDRALQAWYRDNAALNAQTDMSWIFPSSYWYPPAFWQLPERFESASRVGAISANNFMVHRNKTVDVLTPSAKILIFENKDFTEKGQPMWNTPRAKPQVACTDGSGKTVNMSRIINDTGLPSLIQPESLLYPSGSWFATTTQGEAEMSSFDYGLGQGFDWTEGFGRPAYFWATRNGIRGRDIR